MKGERLDAGRGCPGLDHYPLGHSQMFGAIERATDQGLDVKSAPGKSLEPEPSMGAW